jgi:hypothetical protein
MHCCGRSKWWAPGAALLVIASPAWAQQPDSAHPAPAPAAATAPAAPTYPLVPTPVLNLRTLSPRVGISGYLTARALHRNDSTAITMTRARLTAMVAPKPYLGIRLQAEFSSSQTGRARADSTVAGFALTDAYLQLTAPPAVASRSRLLTEVRPALLAGQFKLPFSLEYLTPISIIKTVNRAQAVDRLSLKRDIGVAAQGGWTRYFTLAVAVANGEGANATSNPDNRAVAMSRLTLAPLPGVALAAKIANEGGDHAWGYDGRLLWRGLTLEGETVFRKRPTSPTARVDAGGGYVLAAYRLLPWLEPVYKYDRYWDTRTTVRPTGMTMVASSGTWNVMGVNVITVPEWLRLQLDWTHRDDKPTPGRVNELVAQVVAIF